VLQSSEAASALTSDVGLGQTFDEIQRVRKAPAGFQYSVYRVRCKSTALNIQVVLQVWSRKTYAGNSCHDDDITQACRLGSDIELSLMATYNCPRAAASRAMYFVRAWLTSTTRC